MTSATTNATSPAPPAIQRFSARVSDAQTLNNKFHYLHFELTEPHLLEFSAGQYVLLEIPGEGKKRSYSIASAPEMDHAIELLVDISPQGEGTRYIAGLKPGDNVAFHGPVGHFGMAPSNSAVGQEEKALVFVATGSGVTPLRSMMLDQLQRLSDTREMILYWGLRHMDDSFWVDDFHELEETYPNFHLHLVFSQAGPEWPLCRGRVTDCLRIHPMLEYAGYYLCGNGKMIAEVRAFVAERGVKEEHIHNEQFYTKE